MNRKLQHIRAFLKSLFTYEGIHVRDEIYYRKGKLMTKYQIKQMKEMDKFWFKVFFGGMTEEEIKKDFENES